MEDKSFKEKMRQLSDEEIINALRMRKFYQDDAVEEAIIIALERKIIASRNDLEKPEFKALDTPGRGMFPVGNSLEQTKAILKSICRVFYGFGIIPVIFGVMEIANKKMESAALCIIAGLIVIIAAYLLDRNQKPLVANFFLVLNIPAIGYAIHRLSAMGTPTFMDTFAVVIILVVVLYTTFYANKLASVINAS